MILVTLSTPNGYALGLKTERGIINVPAAADALRVDDVPTTLEAVFAQGTSRLGDLASATEGQTGSWLIDEASISFGPCVPNPSKIICIGLNYRRHAEETKSEIPTSPIVFSKFSNALAASGEPIPLPKVSEQVDYEAELGVVIGRVAKDVSEADALNYVFGYCNANDVSARDLQKRTSQWLLGKSLDKFAPIGPYLVSADEAGDPGTMPVRGWLNGELRQNSSTADLIFGVPYLVSYLSQHMTLLPGDVILTGTPEGVIAGHEHKVWIKPGDEYRVEIGKLGQLVNTFVAG